MNAKSVFVAFFCIMIFSRLFGASEDNEVWTRKLNTIILPEFNAQGASVKEAVELLRSKSEAFDPDMSDPFLKGIDFIIKPPADASAAKITLTLRNVPVIKALKSITDQANLRFDVAKHGVVIALKQTPMISQPAVKTEPIENPPASINDCYQYVATIKGDKSTGSGFIAVFQNTPVLFTSTGFLGGNQTFAATLQDGKSVVLKGLTVADKCDVTFMQQSTVNHGIQIMNGIGKNVDVGDAIVIMRLKPDTREVEEISGTVSGIEADRVEVDANLDTGSNGSPVIHRRSGKVIGMVTSNTVYKIEGEGGDMVFKRDERHYACRLDNILGLANVTWKPFQAESVIMNNIKARTQDVWNLAVDISKNGQIVDWDTHTQRDNYIRTSVSGWQKAIGNKSRTANSDVWIRSEKERLVNGILSSVTIDLSFIKPESLMAFHRKEFAEQLECRQSLKRYFDFVRQQLPEDPASFIR